MVINAHLCQRHTVHTLTSWVRTHVWHLAFLCMCAPLYVFVCDFQEVDPAYRQMNRERVAKHSVKTRTIQSYNANTRESALREIIGNKGQTLESKRKVSVRNHAHMHTRTAEMLTRARACARARARPCWVHLACTGVSTSTLRRHRVIVARRLSLCSVINSAVCCVALLVG